LNEGQPEHIELVDTVMDEINSMINILQFKYVPVQAQNFESKYAVLVDMELRESGHGGL
jgi:hypothetical protein